MDHCYPKPIEGCQKMDRSEALMQGFDCGYPDDAFFRKCPLCPRRANLAQPKTKDI